jgi:hypothetical protein
VASDDRRTGRSAAWGVATLLFGGGAIAVWQAASPTKSTVPIWPAYVLGAIVAVALFMCFATIFSWWPTARSIRGREADAAESSAADHDADGTHYLHSASAPDPTVGSTAAGVEQPSFAVTHIPFTPPVGHVLDAASARAQLDGRGFLTTDVLLAVLDLPDSAVEKCLGRFSPGFADQVRVRLRNALETAAKSPDYPKWQPFNLDLRREVLRARELASEGRDPEVTELHLLLGILDNERSQTRQNLATLLGPEGFNRLRSITARTLAEPVTPGSRTEESS